MWTHRRRCSSNCGHIDLRTRSICGHNALRRCSNCGHLSQVRTGFVDTTSQHPSTRSARQTPRSRGRGRRHPRPTGHGGRNGSRFSPEIHASLQAAPATVLESLGYRRSWSRPGPSAWGLNPRSWLHARLTRHRPGPMSACTCTCQPGAPNRSAVFTGALEKVCDRRRAAPAATGGYGGLQGSLHPRFR